MKTFYNADGTVHWQVGWLAKLAKPSYDTHDAHKPLKDKILEIEDMVRTNQGHVALKFKDLSYWYWEGFFMKVAKQFKPGEKVKYVGANHSGAYDQIVNRTLTVLSINTDLSNEVSQVVNFVELAENEWMIADNFEKQDTPNLKEVLFDACNNDVITEGRDLYLDVSNHRATKMGLVHTKQDILSVLRILERYHVKARINFHTELKECLSITVDAGDIMEELSNRDSTTLPIAALEEICNTFDVLAYVGSTQYAVGFDLDIYETKEFPVPSVQKA